jgi:hypothetical protein
MRLGKVSAQPHVAGWRLQKYPLSAAVSRGRAPMTATGCLLGERFAQLRDFGIQRLEAIGGLGLAQCQLA